MSSSTPATTSTGLEAGALLSPARDCGYHRGGESLPTCVRAADVEFH